MKNVPWLLAFIFFCLSVFLFYNFAYKGDGLVEPDGRISIEVSKEEKNFILQEMRNFLKATKDVSEGIVEKDIEKVIAAGTTGSGIIERVPTSLMRKLPLAFKKTGFSTQNKFRDIARLARDKGDYDEILKEYNVMLKHCVECHAKYKIADLE